MTQLPLSVDKQKRRALKVWRFEWDGWRRFGGSSLSMDSMVVTEAEGAVERDGQSRDVKNVIAHNLRVWGTHTDFYSAQNQS